MPEYIRRPYKVHAEKTKKPKVIHTLEGDMKASPGDMIVTGRRGEKWPVKPGIFEESYRTAEKVTKKAEVLRIRELKENPLNRDIDRAKVDEIKRAIIRTGQIKPLVYTEIMTDDGKENMLTDGHHRYVALREMGYKRVPAVMADERGIETANTAKPEQVKKAKRKCPEGHYRDKDGKCRRRHRYGYGGGVLVIRPKPPKNGENGNGNGGTPPPTNGSGVTKHTPGGQQHDQKAHDPTKGQDGEEGTTVKLGRGRFIGELYIVLDEIKHDPNLPEGWQSMFQKVKRGGTQQFTNQETKILRDELENIADKDAEEYPENTRAAHKLLRQLSSTKKFIKHTPGGVQHDQSTHTPKTRRKREAVAGATEAGAIHLATIAIPAVVVGTLMRIAPRIGLGVVGVTAAFLLYELPQLAFRIAEGGVRGYEGERPYRASPTKMMKVGNRDVGGQVISRGDHALVIYQGNANVGVHLGGDVTRLLDGKKLVDVKTNQTNRMKISTGEDVPSARPEDTKKTRRVLNELIREQATLLNLAQNLKQRSKSVQKQDTHSRLKASRSFDRLRREAYKLETKANRGVPGAQEKLDLIVSRLVVLDAVKRGVTRTATKVVKHTPGGQQHNQQDHDPTGGKAPERKKKLRAQLRPAFRLHGKIYAGKRGQTHANIYDERSKIRQNFSDVVDGFVDAKGNFMTRNQALNRVDIASTEDLQEYGVGATEELKPEKLVRAVEKIRDFAATLNRMDKAGIMAAPVSGLGLVREDLGARIARGKNKKRRSEKGWMTGRTIQLSEKTQKLNMDREGSNTRRPAKNPDGPQIEGSRV